MKFVKLYIKLFNFSVNLGDESIEEVVSNSKVRSDYCLLSMYSSQELHSTALGWSPCHCQFPN